MGVALSVFEAPFYGKRYLGKSRAIDGVGIPNTIPTRSHQTSQAALFDPYFCIYNVHMKSSKTYYSTFRKHMTLSYKSQLMGWACFYLGATSATALLLGEQTCSEILKALTLKALYCFSKCHNTVRCRKSPHRARVTATKNATKLHAALIFYIPPLSVDNCLYFTFYNIN
jgi:hypothetical protein